MGPSSNVASQSGAPPGALPPTPPVTPGAPQVFDSTMHFWALIFTVPIFAILRARWSVRPCVGSPRRSPRRPPLHPQLNEAQLLALHPNAVLVSKRQEGNPVLRHMRNVRWQFGDIVPDYLAGPNTAILFLSLR